MGKGWLDYYENTGVITCSLLYQCVWAAAREKLTIRQDSDCGKKIKIEYD